MINEKIINMNLAEIMSDRFKRYSKYIIQDRALPNGYDGLKPVQRRILFAMYNLKLWHDQSYKKSARIVGEVIGKYHPHGDNSIYDALVRLSQPWKINMPLIDLHGNNGSIDDDSPAAMRYTEIRLTHLAETMLEEINNKVVDYAPNFDDSEAEPTVLPSLFPNLLVNGAKGIAAGFATEMPPHNLGEVLKAVVHRIKFPNASLNTINNFINGPDFPTGGVIIGKSGIEEAHERGKGRIIIRSRYQLIDNNTILITEIPYGVVKSKLVRQIDEIRVNNKIYGIKEVQDQSDRDGLQIEIKLFADAKNQAVLSYLLQKTQLQIYYSYNNIAIVNKAPKLLTLLNLIDIYIEHQKKIILKISHNNLAKAIKKHQVVLALIIASKNIDKILDLILQASGSRKGVIQSLMREFNFSELQSSAIADLKLYRLSKTDQSIFYEEREKLTNQITFLKEIIGDSKVLNNYLIKKIDLFNKTFRINRKTTICNEEKEELVVEQKNLVKSENFWLGISQTGYIKLIKLEEYQQKSLDKYKVKNDDKLLTLAEVNSLEHIVFFTNYARFITIPIFKLELSKMESLGIHLNQYTNISHDEKVIHTTTINDENLNQYVILISKQGKIKKTVLKQFLTTRYKTPLLCFKLLTDDRLVSVSISDNTNNILLITSDGKSVKYPETLINSSSLKTSGVKAISLKNNNLIKILIVNETDQIVLLTNKNKILKINVNKIEFSSRTSQGKLLFSEFRNNQSEHFTDAFSTTEILAVLNLKPDEKQIIFLNDKQLTVDKWLSKFKLNKETIINFVVNGKIKKQENNEINFNQKFIKAEERIKKITQLSVDDLLKKYK